MKTSTVPSRPRTQLRRRQGKTQRRSCHKSSHCCSERRLGHGRAPKETIPGGSTGWGVATAVRAHVGEQKKQSKREGGMGSLTWRDLMAVRGQEGYERVSAAERDREDHDNDRSDLVASHCTMVVTGVIREGELRTKWARSL